jgi:hypothetical protein
VKREKKNQRTSASTNLASRAPRHRPAHRRHCRRWISAGKRE